LISVARREEVKRFYQTGDRDAQDDQQQQENFS
jgi:hypothetical protein